MRRAGQKLLGPRTGRVPRAKLGEKQSQNTESETFGLRPEEVV